MMTYPELLFKLWRAGFTRVERDDRLLDVFPVEDREKGIELWERWEKDVVHILRVKVPFKENKLQLFNIPKSRIVEYLQLNAVQMLNKFPLQAQGECTIQYLDAESRIL